MLLERLGAQRVAVLLGVVERDRAGVEERRHGAREAQQALVVADDLVEVPDVLGGLAHGRGGLRRDAGHEVQVEAAAPVLERRDDRLLDLLHRVVLLAERRAHAVVVALDRDLDRVVVEVLVEELVELLGGRLEELEADGVLHVDLLQAPHEVARVLAAGLQEVVEHEHRARDVLLDVRDVADEQLGIAEGDLVAAEVLAERRRRAAARHAVVRAAAARERRADGVLQPVLERDVAPIMSR